MRTTLPLLSTSTAAPGVTRSLLKQLNLWKATRRVSLLGLLGVGIAFNAQAQFPVNEAFTGTTPVNFQLGGGAILTGTANTPGYLRLTNNSTNQAGYAILKNSFPAPSGFSISFEFFSYGGSTPGADGISVFLVDANGTDPTTNPSQFTIGAYGGSLGYAQKTQASGAVTADIAGATKGYLGIGIDEYGNFATSGEGRVGGYTTTATNGTTNTTTLVPQSVTLRGPGTGTSNYQYLTSSGTLPFKLNVATVEAQSTSADYRKAFIYVIPQVDGTYKVTVRIQNGPTAVATTTYNYSIATPPANLRVGFAGSTGGLTDYHEIRNLSIVQNPIATDDAAQTRYPSSSTVTFNVASNDKGVGATLAPGTVDLDPSTITVDNTYTVAGKGTFTVDSNGNVTFTPSGTFSGVVSIPYTIADVTGALSNPAMISVTVTGADVATNVSGPATASPGSTITYTVATTNNGVETATNVKPTLQLPAGLTIPASANYTTTTNSSGTLVTFNQVTLATNGSASNSVTVTVPTSGTSSITATSGYTYPTNAIVPDAVASNNSSSLITAVSGTAAVATSCATPGKDGPGTLAAGTIPNTYYPGVSVSTPSGGVSTITVGTASTGNTAPVAVGDLVLVMQMQDGTNMSTANSTAYGSFSTATPSTAGQYEYAMVTGVSGSPITTITLSKGLSNSYATNSTKNFQVIRVPQYSSLTVNGVVTGAAWNGQTHLGGILALDVAGVTTFSGTTPGLSMTAKGFNGGGGKSYSGVSGASNSPTVYGTLTTFAAHGAKGEGIAGTPHYTYNGTTVVDNGAESFATGDNNIGAPANGGGGAQDFAPTTNTGNSGGGGGSNYGAGGTGGYGAGSGNNGSGNQATGGYAYISPFTTPTALLMGGGGGAGSVNTGTAANSSGGVGGGIIVLRTGSVSGVATIEANGGSAPTGSNTTTQGGGGGGAGGTILLLATPVSGPGNLTSLVANATGGAGGTVNLIAGATSYGPGGGGGGGLVLASSALNANANVAGGTNGQTNTGNQNLLAKAYGAGAGSIGASSTSITAASTNTIGGANSCLPSLTVSLSTATPNVVRTGSATSAPKPATYTATISNVGGTAANSSTTLSMDPLFTYDNTVVPTVTLTLSNGTSTTLAASSYTLTGISSSSPAFSGITIPSGATLSITYQATISASAVNGTAYQTGGSVTFTDPTRTTTSSQTTTPASTFAGGGTVPGNNYVATSTTLEDVTIVAPLPVELTSFEVVSVRQDALLTWTTASEQNNDHFVVERSVNGTDFVAVGTVRGQGISARATSYTFTDAGAGRLTSGMAYYRLRPVALDGNATFSPVRTVKFAAAAKAYATLYPNPSEGQTTLDLSGLPAGTYAVQVLDLAGRVLRTQQMSAQATPLDLAGLPQGAYLVLVQGKDVKQTLPLLRN